jgi:hypothetical protein
MRRRLAKLVAAALVVVAQGLHAAPADANSTFAVTFMGFLNVTGGLGDPVTTLTTTSHLLPGGDPSTTAAHFFGATEDPSQCLPLNSDLDTVFGLVDDDLTNCHWRWDHVRSVSLSLFFCEDVGVNVGKPKLPAHAGPCTFGSVFTPNFFNFVTGHCGQFSGKMSISYVNAMGQRFIVFVHFHALLDQLVMSGHWTKVGTSQHGLLLGVARLLAPDPVTNPGQSCEDKDASDFTIVGAATGVTETSL